MHLKQKATVSIIQVYTGLFMVQTLSARNRHSLIFSGGILVFIMTYRKNQTLTTDEILHWDDIMSNPGKNYDVVTGTYTAPHDGHHQFSVTKRTAVQTPFALY